MKKYRSMTAMAAALRSGEIPAEVVSPGGAAAALGVTRQTIHDRCKTGSLECWKAEGYVLISARSLKREVRKKRGIPEGQGELHV